MVKNPPANVGDARDSGLVPGSGTSPGVRNGNLLQDCCLENSTDRGAWWAIAHGAAESDMTDHTCITTECIQFDKLGNTHTLMMSLSQYQGNTQVCHLQKLPHVPLRLCVHVALFCFQ